MEHKLLELLLALNRASQKAKELSAELERITAGFVDEDFEGVVAAEQLSLISTEDYE